MFTLAVGVSVFYFVQQNTVYFNGSDGIAGVSVPNFLKKGFHYDAVPFLNYANTTYWFMLICALLLFALTIHLNTTPLGLVFKSIRDNPRRLNALGYSVSQYRVLAFVISGFIAGIGGIMLTWYNAQISPGTIDVGGNVAILIIAVLGGQKNLLCAFIGAFVYVLLELFASELIGPERFNLVIGATFLLVLYFSPNGIIGLLPMIAKTFRRFKCRI
jgi:branched-chain amino acid transport system permease protein